ncbi:glycosyltransferase [Plastorhodobacter daqingensis]|uniref:Glycosyltransferase n=1 Tax=Plastorhodobacter daqingensis TaxID=1387281 RepID=A0ABW2UHX7_9RHOB
MEIVGICRFSFLGQGDWRAFRGGRSSAEASALVEQTARKLFDPARLAFRLRTFEHICLRSIAGQSDQNFKFVIVTAEQLPDDCFEQLHELCRPYPNVFIRKVGVMDTVDAVERAVSTVLDDKDSHLQFRLDDDDGVFQHYIRDLGWIGRKLAALDSFAVSFARTLVAESFGKEDVQYALRKQPFLSAGAAAKVGTGVRSVFSYGHHQLKHRMPSFVDTRPIGALMLHHHGNDQPRKQDLGKNTSAETVAPDRAKQFLRESFPYFSHDMIHELLTGAGTGNAEVA